jgi:hypothetical protein
MSEDSSLYMQARWDWSDSSVAGKWGTPYEVFRPKRQIFAELSEGDGPFVTGQPVVVARNKVRGRGRALHIKWEAYPGKDAHLLGWSTNFEVLTDN